MSGLSYWYKNVYPYLKQCPACKLNSWPYDKEVKRKGTMKYERRTIEGKLYDVCPRCHSVTAVEKKIKGVSNAE
jgi:hypothetical protein